MFSILPSGFKALRRECSTTNKHKKRKHTSTPTPTQTRCSSPSALSVCLHLNAIATPNPHLPSPHPPCPAPSYWFVVCFRTVPGPVPPLPLLPLSCLCPPPFSLSRRNAQHQRLPPCLVLSPCSCPCCHYSILFFFACLTAGLHRPEPKGQRTPTHTHTRTHTRTHQQHHKSRVREKKESETEGCDTRVRMCLQVCFLRCCCCFLLDSSCSLSALRCLSRS